MGPQPIRHLRGTRSIELIRARGMGKKAAEALVPACSRGFGAVGFLLLAVHHEDTLNKPC